jgi:hypothetical protein
MPIYWRRRVISADTTVLCIIVFVSFHILNRQSGSKGWNSSRHRLLIKLVQVVFLLKICMFKLWIAIDCHSLTQPFPSFWPTQFFVTIHTANTKCRQFETNIPRKGITGSQSQFPHSCVCERIIYSHNGSAFSAGDNMWTDPGNI